MKTTNKQSFKQFQNYQESRRLLRTPVKSGVSLKTWYNCTAEESEVINRFHNNARSNGNIDFKTTVDHNEQDTQITLGLKEPIAPEDKYLD